MLMVPDRQRQSISLITLRASRVFCNEPAVPRQLEHSWSGFVSFLNYENGAAKGDKGHNRRKDKG
jgi:hypothetical protein